MKEKDGLGKTKREQERQGESEKKKRRRKIQDVTNEKEISFGPV